MPFLAGCCCCPAQSYRRSDVRRGGLRGPGGELQHDSLSWDRLGPRSGREASRNTAIGATTRPTRKDDNILPPLFIDSSALVKLYSEEPASDDVKQAVQAASLVVVAAVAYAEVRAAIASRQRAGDLSPEEELAAAEAFDDDWRWMAIVAINEAVSVAAGELAHRHGLRGYDAIQLSAALVARGQWPELVLATFDDELLEAAAAEEIPLW